MSRTKRILVETTQAETDGRGIAIPPSTALPPSLFLNLQKVAKALVESLGSQCEVVIHDFSDLDHSIVWIEGDVTGREIGGCVTDLGLVQLGNAETQDLHNYRTIGPNGQKLKSSSVFLKGEAGETIGAFCINMDVSSLEVAQQVLTSLLWVSEGQEVEETFVDDVPAVLDTMLANCALDLGKPSRLMGRSDKITLMQALDEKGAFRLKGAIPILADRLGVTRQTIYNYLEEARSDGDGKRR